MAEDTGVDIAIGAWSLWAGAACGLDPRACWKVRTAIRTIYYGADGATMDEAYSILAENGVISSTDRLALLAARRTGREEFITKFRYVMDKYSPKGDS